MKIRIYALAILAFTAAWLPSAGAKADCARCCNCETIRGYIRAEITQHEQWLIDVFWTQNFEPTLSKMTNNINSALMSQAAAVGSFLDAQNNSERIRLMQELNADAAATYMPSEQLCSFASLGQSLAATEEKAKANRLFLMERSQSRQLSQPNMASTNGGYDDLKARMSVMRVRYCDSNDNNAQMKNLCNATDDKYLNGDIDYVRTFDSKPTLNIDFMNTNTTFTAEEQNVLSLADNLFANDLFSRPAIGNMRGGKELSDARQAFMDMRSLVAKRSVAENSFNTLLGMRARGTGIGTGGAVTGSTSYIASVLKGLGLSDKEALNYLGEAPSYDAQMEVLTKKIYQNPAFYVNLMESPANVQRQYAAMQSFGLMQQRDIFESILRSEMILSLIVELEVTKYQDEAQALMDKK